MAPKVSPAEKCTEDAYTPQSETMKHDAFFGECAPGVVGSGNLAHQWAVPGNHSNSEEPPTDIDGE